MAGRKESEAGVNAGGKILKVPKGALSLGQNRTVLHISTTVAAFGAAAAAIQFNRTLQSALAYVVTLADGAVSDFGVFPPKLVRLLEAQGFTAPSPIQCASWPVISMGTPSRERESIIFNPPCPSTLGPSRSTDGTLSP